MTRKKLAHTVFGPIRPKDYELERAGPIPKLIEMHLDLAAERGGLRLTAAPNERVEPAREGGDPIRGAVVVSTSTGEELHHFPLSLLPGYVAWLCQFEREQVENDGKVRLRQWSGREVSFQAAYEYGGGFEIQLKVT